MADEEKTVFSIDLDNADFLAKLTGIKNEILKVGSEENLSGLIGGLTKLAAPIAIAAAGVFAFKKGLDLALEGESIEMVHRQFERLTEGAGIAGEELKSGMLKAADGTMTETELLKASNEAIIRMGSSAKRLPEIMELARKASVSMGGSVEEHFHRLSEAIETGRVRTLKWYGIHVDATKAAKDFAAANGVSEKALTATGKQQAIMNAALDAGKVAFAGISTQNETLKVTLEKNGTALKEVGEAFAGLFNKASPVFKFLINGWTDVLKWTKAGLVAIGGGTEAEQAEHKLESLQNKMWRMTEAIDKLESHKGNALDKLFPAENQKRIDMLKASLADMKKEYDALAKSPAIRAPSAEKGKDSSVDLEKEAAENRKFEETLRQMREKRLQQELRDAKTSEEVEKNHVAQKANINKKYQDDVAKMQEQYAGQPKKQAALQV
jgi:hypothetical protein